MTKKTISLGITSRCDYQSALEIVKNILLHLSHGLDNIKILTIIDNRTAEKIGKLYNAISSPIDKMQIDLMISVGGDGTILRAIQKMEIPKPILGINMGTIGFLADVDPIDALEVINKMLIDCSNNTLEVEERIRLKANNMPPATNEIVISTGTPAKMSHFKIYVDDCELEEFRADGVIFATPTGSTAYAMSAGGPIVDPRVNATVMVPLAPFKLSARPWVIPAKSEIKVQLLSKKGGLIVIDGQYTKTIHGSDSIVIKMAEHPAIFVKTKKTGFYEKFRYKLE
ncbi:MAG: NAD(+)/NADH kinase [Methanosarcinales archaeon]